MKKSHFMWLAVPACLYLPWMIPGCAGELTQDEKDALLAGGTTVTSGTSMDCGILAMEKSCTSADGVCHGGSPPIVGLDLTAAGIAAANNGDDFVGRAPSNDVAVGGAACSPMSAMPIMGKFIIDKDNPEASLLYAKMQAGPPCGARMPLLPRPKQPMVVSATDQACILTWIKARKGVSAGGGSGAGGAGGSGGSGNAAGSGGSGGSAAGAGGSGGSGG